MKEKGEGETQQSCYNTQLPEVNKTSVSLLNKVAIAPFLFNACNTTNNAKNARHHHPSYIIDSQVSISTIGIYISPDAYEKTYKLPISSGHTAFSTGTW